MLNVKLYAVDPGDADHEATLAEVYSDTVKYVSLYNSETHGPPALVAPYRDHGVAVQPKARAGDSVFYINTALIAAYKIERLSEGV